MIRTLTVLAFALALLALRLGGGVGLAQDDGGIVLVGKDRPCVTFGSQDNAQAAFDADPEGLAHLDEDGDGIVCENEAQFYGSPDGSVGDGPGRGPYQCWEFASQEDAQVALEWGAAQLDTDGDGVACNEDAADDDEVSDDPSVDPCPPRANDFAAECEPLLNALSGWTCADFVEHDALNDAQAYLDAAQDDNVSTYRDPWDADGDGIACNENDDDVDDAIVTSGSDAATSDDDEESVSEVAAASAADDDESDTPTETTTNDAPSRAAHSVKLPNTGAGMATRQGGNGWLLHMALVLLAAIGIITRRQWSWPRRGDGS